MRVYMDVCCLNRPYDDQTQDRVHMEAEAVLGILTWCRLGTMKLVGSKVIDYEVSKTSDEDKRKKLSVLCKVISEKIELDREVRHRAFELEGLGFKAVDALHISCAERGKVDAFLTTDDKLLKKAFKEKEKILVSILNPLKWLMNIGDESKHGKADYDTE